MSSYCEGTLIESEMQRTSSASAVISPADSAAYAHDAAATAFAAPTTIIADVDGAPHGADGAYEPAVTRSALPIPASAPSATAASTVTVTVGEDTDEDGSSTLDGVAAAAAAAASSSGAVMTVALPIVDAISDAALRRSPRSDRRKRLSAVLHVLLCCLCMWAVIGALVAVLVFVVVPYALEASQCPHGHIDGNECEQD